MSLPAIKNTPQALLGFSDQEAGLSALILWDDREIDFPRSALPEVLKARAKGEVITIHNNSYAASAVKEVRAHYRLRDVNYDNGFLGGDHRYKRPIDQGKLVKVKSKKTGMILKMLPEYVGEFYELVE